MRHQDWLDDEDRRTERLEQLAEESEREEDEDTIDEAEFLDPNLRKCDWMK